MKQNKPLWQWSACDLAASIRAREISCREAVASVIERMQAKNPDLNAVVIDLSEPALEQAQKADDMIQSGVSAIRPTLGRVPAYNPSQIDERALAAQLFSVQGPPLPAKSGTCG